MEEAYFTIRWKRLLITGAIVGAILVAFKVTEQVQQERLSAKLLATARQLATQDESQDRSPKAAYLDYLELNSADVTARVELIQHVLKTEQQGESRDRFIVSQGTMALRGRDDLPEIRLAVIDAAIRLEWFSTASQWLATARNMKEQYPRLLAYEGLCLLRKGEPDQAEASFRSALFADSDCQPAWIGLIEIQEVREGAAKAVQTADEWIQKTNSAEAWLQKAKLLVQAGDPERAALVFQTAELPDGNDVELIRQLAHFFVHELPQRQNVDEATLRSVYDLLKTGVGQHSYEDLVCLADLSHRLGDVDLAQRHYQQCLENRPGDLFAMGRQVELFGMQGLSDEALNSLDKMPNYSSQRVLKITLKAKLLMQQSRFEEAAIDLNSAVQMPTDARIRRDAFGMLIECLWALGRNDEAATQAEELLSLAASSKTGRRFCAEALIRSSRYSDAIKCIHGFIDAPREQINAIWRLMDHAQQMNQQSLLSTSLDDARKTNREATVPVVTEAFSLADGERSTEARTILLKAQLANPDRAAFVVAMDALKARISNRLNQTQISHVSQLTDPLDQATYLESLITENENLALEQLAGLFRTAPHNDTTLQALDLLIDATSEDAAVQRKLIQTVYPGLNSVVARQGLSAVPRIAEILCRCDLEEPAFTFLHSAMKKDSSVFIVDSFLRRMRQADAASPFHATEVARLLLSKDHQFPETTQAILRIECDLLSGRTAAAKDELRALLTRDDDNELALLLLMTYADQLDFPKEMVSHPDLQLTKKYPSDASVLLACSRWNRRQQHYSTASRQAQEAYLLRQDSQIFIELAYLDWLDNQPIRAGHLLQRALTARTSKAPRSARHSVMLKEMLADSRIDIPGLELSQRDNKPTTAEQS